MTAGVSSQDPPVVEASPTGPAVRDERDRIAARLLGSVIRRLFPAGLSMNAAAAQLETGGGPGASRRALARIHEAMTVSDEAIAEVRSTVYEPNPVDHPSPEHGETDGASFCSAPLTPST